MSKHDDRNMSEKMLRREVDAILHDARRAFNGSDCDEIADDPLSDDFDSPRSMPWHRYGW